MHQSEDSIKAEGVCIALDMAHVVKSCLGDYAGRHVDGTERILRREWWSCEGDESGVVRV